MLLLLGVVRKSTRPEIALVEPIGAEQSSCSQSALVIAVSRVRSRKTAIIMAEDSGFGSTTVHIICTHTRARAHTHEFLHVNY